MTLKQAINELESRLASGDDIRDNQHYEQLESILAMCNILDRD